MYESMEIDKDKIVIERIDKHMKRENIKRADIAKTLQWPPYKITRFFSGEQRTTLKDLIDVTTALGYPLEAFLEEDFDLTKYESENRPANLATCMEIYKEGYPAEDVIEEVISQGLPYAMRKILNLNMKEFSFVYDTNRFDVPNVLNSDNQAQIRYWPKVTIRLQGVLSAYNDHLEFGYFFAAKDAVALCVNYVPDAKKNEPGSGMFKRKFYKGLIEDMEVDSFDNRTPRFVFDPKLNHGEICSIIYDLSRDYSEEIFEEDLRDMFVVFRELIIEATDKMESFFWQATRSNDMPVLRIMGNEEVAEEAKALAGYKCFMDEKHETFETDNGKMYVDTMHLVPLELQDEYETSLDVVGNIVCLCPNCMAKMTNAKRSIREKMLVDIYYRKKQELSEAGLNASLAQVLTAQQCD